MGCKYELILLLCSTVYYVFTYLSKSSSLSTLAFTLCSTESCDMILSSFAILFCRLLPTITYHDSAFVLVKYTSYDKKLKENILELFHGEVYQHVLFLLWRSGVEIVTSDTRDRLR